MKKHIAIIGGGLSGSAVAYFAQKQGFRVTVYYQDLGASFAASGLCHPYAGRRCRLNRLGIEGLEATRRVIEDLERQFDVSIFVSHGIRRRAVDAKMEEALKKLGEAQGFPWIGKDLFIPQGFVIDARAYLEAFRHLEIDWRPSFVDQVQGVDVVVYAIGYRWPTFTRVKGQTLRVDHHFSDPISSDVYGLHLDGEGLMGATYEHTFVDAHIDLDTARELLRPKIERLLGYMPQVSAGLSGIRAVSADHMPRIERLDSTHYMIGGMGSKGLLYHALYANALVARIVSDLRIV